MKAVIFAAGLGTRLQPFTNNIPKALVKIDGRTLLELAITYLKNNGVNEFVINIHHFGDKILEYLEEQNNFGVKILISDERDILLDTGGGLMKMEEYLGCDDFIIFNVDILTDIDISAMLKFHQKTESLITLAVRNRETSRYFLFDKKHRLNGWKNIKTGEVKYCGNTKQGLIPLAFSGIHIVNPKIFKYKPSEKIFSIVKLYLELSKFHKISGFQHDDSFWLDVGKISVLEEAKKVIKNLSFL